MRVVFHMLKAEALRIWNGSGTKTAAPFPGVPSMSQSVQGLHLFSRFVFLAKLEDALYADRALAKPQIGTNRNSSAYWVVTKHKLFHEVES